VSWTRLDDQLHGHRKILRAWKCRPALGLHFMAMSYAASHEPQGFVPCEWVEEKLPNSKERERTIAALTDVSPGFTAGLWEPVEGGWNIHDWDEYNGDARTREEVRAAKSAAGKKGAAARWGNRQTDDRPDDTAMAACHSAANGTAIAPSPNPSHTAKTALSDASDLDAARARLKTSTEQQVFDAWIEATGRTGATVFSDKRRRLIRNALKLYSTADVLDAVQGWRKSSHHCGENDTGTVYNDLELLLRDAAHIEKFRDLHRNGNGSAPEPRGDGFGERLNAKAIR
jgi:hypothetical protein